MNLELAVHLYIIDVVTNDKFLLTDINSLHQLWAAILLEIIVKFLCCAPLTLLLLRKGKEKTAVHPPSSPRTKKKGKKVKTLSIPIANQSQSITLKFRYSLKEIWKHVLYFSLSSAYFLSEIVANVLFDACTEYYFENLLSNSAKFRQLTNKLTNSQRQDSGTRETRDSVSEGPTVTPPAPSPSPPPAAAPLTPSPEPEFTGDDIVDMFG